MPPSRLPYAVPFVRHLAFDLADFKQVRAHWQKHSLRRFRPTDPVHALMGRVLHQIHTDGYVLREAYVFPLEEVIVADGEYTREEQARAALYQLDSVCFFFKMPTQQLFIPRYLLDSTKPQSNHCTSTSLTVLFNLQLREYLLNVAQLDELFPPAQPPQ